MDRGSHFSFGARAVSIYIYIYIYEGYGMRITDSDRGGRKGSHYDDYIIYDKKIILDSK